MKKEKKKKKHNAKGFENWSKNKRKIKEKIVWNHTGMFCFLCLEWREKRKKKMKWKPGKSGSVFEPKEGRKNKESNFDLEKNSG